MLRHRIADFAKLQDTSGGTSGRVHVGAKRRTDDLATLIARHRRATHIHDP
jgi:hypothetical protein